MLPGKQAPRVVNGKDDIVKEMADKVNVFPDQEKEVEKYKLICICFMSVFSPIQVGISIIQKENSDDS